MSAAYIIDYYSCRRRISTNPGSAGARELAPKRVKCSVASRLDLVAVAELLGLSDVLWV